MELLDTPGILWPKFEDAEIGFSLAVTGSVKEEVFDREQAVRLLVDKLQAEYPGILFKNYALTASNYDESEDILHKIARARGCLKAGGVADIDKVIQMVLRDFRTGRLGRFTLDNP